MPSHKRLSVVYLLDDTVLFGGVKVILHQANLLADRGHRVIVVSRGSSPDWFQLRAEFRQVSTFTRDTTPPADVTVATYWTTIAPALEAARGEVAHYCQGYEATYTHNTADHPAIVEAYRKPVPALVVSQHLGQLLRENFGRPYHLVVQPLESFWKVGVRSRLKRGACAAPRVLVVGPWEGDWKGVPTALAAIDHMRRAGCDARLIRLSQYPLSRTERSQLTPDEYHCHIPPEEVAPLVRSCDLLLAPSWEQEGFGLPVLEAFASGVPVVASEISSFRGFAATAAVLVPARDPIAFSLAAREILENPKRWRHHRATGLAVAARYTSRRAAESAEAALCWVASGQWRLDYSALLTRSRDEAGKEK
jgi:glycosyltransferase involved in cell wall biosynthesis